MSESHWPSLKHGTVKDGSCVSTLLINIPHQKAFSLDHEQAGRIPLLNMFLLFQSCRGPTNVCFCLFILYRTVLLQGARKRGGPHDLELMASFARWNAART